MSTIDSCYFYTLPNELHYSIFDKVNEPKEVRSVCKHWKNIENEWIRDLAIKEMKRINPKRFIHVKNNCKKQRNETKLSHTIRLLESFLADQNKYLPVERQWGSSSFYSIIHIVLADILGKPPRLLPKNFIPLKIIDNLEKKEKELNAQGYITLAQIINKTSGTFIASPPLSKNSFFKKAEWYKEKIEEISPEFYHLNLSGCNLKQLPDNMFHLKHLVNLILQLNQLSSLPNTIGELTKLEFLDLSFNELTNLPKSVGKLTSLKTLNLSSNYLLSLPCSLKNLKNLKTLDISHNNLRSIPSCIHDLTSLKELNLMFNLIKSSSNDISKIEDQGCKVYKTNQLIDKSVKILDFLIGKLTMIGFFLVIAIVLFPIYIGVSLKNVNIKQ